jgi:16S rRNA C1402 (ribose-2'-O) methylase RsmI
LEEATSIFVDRPIVVGKELTKIHEKLVTWENSIELDDTQLSRGEFVIVLGANSGIAGDGSGSVEPERLFGLITEHVTNDDDAAVKAVAAILGRPVRQVRTAIKKARIRARRAEEDGLS